VQEKEIKKILSEAGTEIVFTYASAGLGHLRCTDALKDGLPKGVSSSIWFPKDESMRFIHRLTSVDPAMRAIMEYVQHGLPQTIFTHFYRNYLRSRGKDIRENLLQRIKKERPKKLVIVTTHFGFAHQVAAIKNNLEKITGCRIILIVQVTDDSPQYIWYVPGADLTFVTSEYVKKGLTEYGTRVNLPKIRIEINPYPLNPSLSIPLNNQEMMEKIAEADAKSKKTIHVLVPISGAAVGTHYIRELMEKMHEKSERYFFHVVSKIAPYTKKFLGELKNKKYIKVYASENDKEVVDLYDEVLKKNVVLLEISKPSEQAFKAVLGPEFRGGVLMLFNQAVGRQEYENLDYLVRRNLIPDGGENDKLWLTALEGKIYSEKTSHLKAGIRLPIEATLAAGFIQWCLEKGIFIKMMLADKNEDNYPNELNGNGVERFWERTAEFRK
jgi:hypothetical protein